MDFEFFFNEPCHFCGETTEWPHGHKPVRIIENHGFDEANCVPACAMCFTMKGDLSYSAFKAQITKMYLQGKSLCVR